MPTDFPFVKDTYFVSEAQECTILAYPVWLDSELVVALMLISLSASEASWAALATFAVSVSVLRPQRLIVI